MEAGNIRVRINVSSTTKGQKTFDVTVEENEKATSTERDETMAHAIADSDWLVDQLERRYRSSVAKVPEPEKVGAS